MNPNLYNVTSTSTSVVLASANTQATERIIQNGLSSPKLYLAYAPTAGPTGYTVALNPGDIFRASYTGIISGYWSGTGTAYITEVSS